MDNKTSLLAQSIYQSRQLYVNDVFQKYNGEEEEEDKYNKLTLIGNQKVKIGPFTFPMVEFYKQEIISGKVSLKSMSEIPRNPSNLSLDSASIAPFELENQISKCNTINDEKNLSKNRPKETHKQNISFLPLDRAIKKVSPSLINDLQQLQSGTSLSLTDANKSFNISMTVNAHQKPQNLQTAYTAPIAQLSGHIKQAHEPTSLHPMEQTQLTSMLLPTNNSNPHQKPAYPYHPYQPYPQHFHQLYSQTSQFNSSLLHENLQSQDPCQTVSNGLPIVHGKSFTSESKSLTENSVLSPYMINAHSHIQYPYINYPPQNKQFQIYQQPSAYPYPFTYLHQNQFSPYQQSSKFYPHYQQRNIIKPTFHSTQPQSQQQQPLKQTQSNRQKIASNYRILIKFQEARHYSVFPCESILVCKEYETQCIFFAPQFSKTKRLARHNQAIVLSIIFPTPSSLTKSLSKTCLKSELIKYTLDRLKWKDIDNKRALGLHRQANLDFNMSHSPHQIRSILAGTSDTDAIVKKARKLKGELMQKSISSCFIPSIKSNLKSDSLFEETSAFDEVVQINDACRLSDSIKSKNGTVVNHER